VCTYAINFTLEADVLHMTVMMRSNDVIFGFTNDAFCFWNLMMFVYALLKEHDTSIRLGTYTHITNSMHVYERHFEMIGKILAKDKRGYNPYAVPMVRADEVRAFLARKRADGAYTAWLTSEQG
jgi:thymidylate synthase